jgi:acetoin utilization protein AcuB
MRCEPMARALESPMTVAEIMTPHLVTVGMDDTLEQIQELFHQHHFHHLMVASGSHLRGVISDRDVLRHVSPFVQTAAAQRRDDATLKMHAHQIMTRRPITVTPQTDVLVAASLIIEKGISCLPVVDANEQLVGVLTWKDLLRSMVQAGRAADGLPR